MTVLRRIAAGILVAVAVVVTTGWAVSMHTVRAIDNGEAVRHITDEALSSPAVAQAVADRLQQAIVDNVDGEAASLALSLLDQRLNELLLSVLSSDLLTDTVRNGVDRVENSLRQELTEPDRDAAPFVLTADLGRAVVARLPDVPGIDWAVGRLDLPVVEVEVMAAEPFEDMREAYRGMQTIATWALVVSIALIALAVGIAPYPRRSAPWLLGGAGAGLVVIALAAGSTAPRTLAGLVPGGRDGGIGTLVEQISADVAVGPITTTVLTCGLVLASLAIVLVVVARWKSRWAAAVAGS